VITFVCLLFVSRNKATSFAARFACQKKSRRSPTVTRQWMDSRLKQVGDKIRARIETIPRQRHQQRRNFFRSSGSHLFGLRLRRKGFRVGQHSKSSKQPEPPTYNQQANRIRLVALATYTQDHQHLVLDSDTYPLAIDTCASQCMTFDLNTFNSNTTCTDYH
jgi:hypothetical protein